MIIGRKYVPFLITNYTVDDLMIEEKNNFIEDFFKILNSRG